MYENIREPNKLEDWHADGYMWKNHGRWVYHSFFKKISNQDKKMWQIYKTCFITTTEIKLHIMGTTMLINIYHVVTGHVIIDNTYEKTISVE